MTVNVLQALQMALPYAMLIMAVGPANDRRKAQRAHKRHDPA